MTLRSSLFALVGVVLLAAPAAASDRKAAASPVPVVPTMSGGSERFAARCEVPGEMLRLGHRLPQVARRLAEGKQLTVVAMGASSTEGIGASAQENAYPERLEAELYALFPGMQIAVHNRGIGGEDAGQMLARIERDVLRVEPDLLIVQAGVNAAMKGWPLDMFVDDMLAIVDTAHRHGIDVMLMGPQNAPRYVNAPLRRQFADNMMMVSRIRDVPIFPRFRIMTHWMQSGAFRADEIVGPDGLHMTDASYYCVARLLARSIASALPEALAPSIAPSTYSQIGTPTKR